MTCAPSEDSAQLGHSGLTGWMPRLIWDGAQRRLWSDWADAQADLSLHWAHRPYCKFCHAAAQISGLLQNRQGNKFRTKNPKDKCLSQRANFKGDKQDIESKISCCNIIEKKAILISATTWKKTTKWVCAQRRLRSAWGIRPVWLESLLYAQWVAKDPNFLHADNEDSDQTGRMPRLIWDFIGHTAILLILSWGGSFVNDMGKDLGQEILKTNQFESESLFQGRQLNCLAAILGMGGKQFWFVKGRQFSSLPPWHVQRPHAT